MGIMEKKMETTRIIVWTAPLWNFMIAITRQESRPLSWTSKFGA